MKKDLNKHRDVPCPRIGRLNIIMIAILLKLIHRFNAIPTKVLAKDFTNTDRITLKFM